MTARGAVLASAIALGALLTGCMSVVPHEPPVTARGIGPGTPSEGGDGAFALTIRATQEPGGPPLPDAGVVAYWDADARPAEEREDRNPTEDDRLSVLRLRTDGRGEAIARLPADRVVGLVVAADGWTEESMRGIATGAAGGQDTLAMPLYREALHLIMTGTWGPGSVPVGALGLAGDAWKPSFIPFGASGEARAGYTERLVELRVVLAWTNGPGATGDLGIGLGTTDREPAYVEDTGPDLQPGAQREELHLAARGLEERGLEGTRGLLLGPTSNTAHATLAGMAYTLDVEARFTS